MKVDHTKSDELMLVKQELAFEVSERLKRATELVIANAECAVQNECKDKRISELVLANEELESFNYVSSHDLQEPLRKVQLLTGLILDIEDQTLSMKGKRYFTRIQSATCRMRTLIDDLLAFSRMGVSDRKFEFVDFNTIIDEVKDELKETIEAKQVTIEATELCTVKIIPFQFRQVMHNLVGNALKFSKPQLAPHIKITSRIATGREFDDERLSPDMCYCHISVADNGIGFDPKYKDQIFDVFQRLHSKHEYAGSGVGLAIVKKVVKNHGGFISATGSPNGGATFNIYLPA